MNMSENTLITDTKTSTKISGTNIVSEFFSENVTYIECEEIDLFSLMEKLNNPKYRSNLDMDIPGIELLENNSEYIKLERSVIIPNKIIKFEKGQEKEENYNKLVKCLFYIFEDFVSAIGDSKAIKNTMDLISDVLNHQLVPLIPQDIAMLRLPDRFETLENVVVDRVKHTNVKKMSVYGRGQDISDLDVKYPGYDISSVMGVIKTGVDERRLKVTKTGKINFYKAKDKPLYIEHLKFGYNLFFAE